jgi:hypothetical protein
MAIARHTSQEERVIKEIQDAISGRWSDARFSIGELPDGEGTGIWTYTTADYLDVTNAVIDMQLDAMDEHGVFVYVIPMPPEAWDN